MPISSTLSPAASCSSCSTRASIFGAHIAGARTQRNLEVGEREQAIRRRDEFLAAHDEQQVEDVLIEHFPRADLLLDHVEAGLLDVHAR